MRAIKFNLFRNGNFDFDQIVTSQLENKDQNNFHFDFIWNINKKKTIELFAMIVT